MAAGGFVPKEERESKPIDGLRRAINELKERRKQLERDIEEAIKPVVLAFEEETGVTIETIEMRSKLARTEDDDLIRFSFPATVRYASSDLEEYEMTCWRYKREGEES